MFHTLKSKLSRSFMGEILGMIHTGTKFLIIYVPMKLENRLSNSTVE